MRWLRYLDPRNWLPGDELTDGILEHGLNEYLPETSVTRHEEVDDIEGVEVVESYNVEVSSITVKQNRMVDGGL